MYRFTGENALNMDAKGRVAVPARMRESLQGEDAAGLVVTVTAKHRCLSAFPLSRWQAVEETFLEVSNPNSLSSHLRMALIGSAQELAFDAQNRILIPGTLREYAGLDRKVRVVGQVDRIHIWDEAAWVASRASAFDQLANLEDTSELDESLRRLLL